MGARNEGGERERAREEMSTIKLLHVLGRELNTCTVPSNRAGEDVVYTLYIYQTILSFSKIKNKKNKPPPTLKIEVR